MSWMQIKQALLDLSASHEQINSFGTGDPSAVGTDNCRNFNDLQTDRVIYPLCFVDVESAQTISSKATLTVGVYFMDRTENVRQPSEVVSGIVGLKDNVDEILNDMLLVAQDYIAFFQDDPDFDFTLQDSVSLNRFIETRDDKVAGWKATLTFDVPFSRNVCAIPS